MNRTATPRFISEYAFLVCLLASTVGTTEARPVTEKPNLVEIECKLVHLSVTAAQTLGLQSADGEQAPVQPAIFPAISMTEFLHLPGIDMMSAPRVTTKSGERAVIEIIREVRYPVAFGADEHGKLVPTEFETSNIGVTLDFEPTVGENEKIDTELQATVSFFDGWTAYKEGKTAGTQGGSVPSGGFNLPVIGRTRFKSEVTLRSEETLLLGGCPSLFSGELPNFVTGEAIMNASQEPARRRRSEPMLQFLFVTVRTLDRNGNPTSGKHSLLNAPVDSVPLPKDISIPYATSSGQVGFVASPFAPTQGHIDVRGFPQDTEVKCPYTGKVFLVP